MPELYKDGISFEIHHSLFEGEEQPVLFEGDGKHSGSVGGDKHRLLEGADAGILSPRIHFLFLVKHLHYHETVQGESQLRLYTDLLMMLKKYGDDLLSAELYRMAEELGMGDMLEELLFLLERFFIATEESPHTDTGTIPDEQRVISRFIDFLDNPKDNVAGISKRKNYRQRVRNIPGRRRRFIYIMGDIFPSYSYMSHRYNTGNKVILTFLYLHRIAKLSWLVF
ncbi:MAG: nucleotidyltransferase family protein [Bacteroidales bacterium]|nr:nucleotidyltransferase family protein [Bacteroidales bacterium]